VSAHLLQVLHTIPLEVVAQLLSELDLDGILQGAYRQRPFREIEFKRTQRLAVKPHECSSMRPAVEGHLMERLGQLKI
jgi:hypothetical protein